MKLTVPLATLDEAFRRDELEHAVAWRGDLPEVHAPNGSRPARLRVDEVDTTLLQALDAAMRADLRALRIIHGKGTGALRERVAEMLRKDTRVRQFRLGAWNEGGAGVTVAELGMIPDDVVERVREQADIVAIIGEYVKLKRVGNSFRGPCPFHQGKDHNFSVSPRGGYMLLRLPREGGRLHLRAEAPRARLRRRGEVRRRKVRHRSEGGRARPDDAARSARAASGR